MPKFKDLTGQRFGRLIVIERIENRGEKVCWRCRCDCGNECSATSNHLTRGDVKSCGCLSAEFCGKYNIHHGMAGTKIYRAWQDMKSRCFSAKNKNYKYYGGRGITVYSEWIDDFQSFYDYVSQLEHFGEKGYSLDRIDNNGNYEPGNLRWADQKTQSRNTRQNIFVEYKGSKITVTDASNLSGINRETLRCRMNRGEKGDYLFRLPR